MTLYFSAQTLGFFSSDIHGDTIPDGAIEISKGEYDAMLLGQSTGCRIVANETGRPMLLGPAPPTEGALRNLIAARRFEAEVSGVQVEGVVFASSRESQGLIASVAQSAMLDPSYSCNWKARESFVALNARQILNLAAQVRIHVQACFDREAELLVHLETGTFTESMLDEGWPI